jgi:hypothetical protein
MFACAVSVPGFSRGYLISINIQSWPRTCSTRRGSIAARRTEYTSRTVRKPGPAEKTNTKMGDGMVTLMGEGVKIAYFNDVMTFDF